MERRTLIYLKKLWCKVQTNMKEENFKKNCENNYENNDTTTIMMMVIMLQQTIITAEVSVK